MNAFTKHFKWVMAIAGVLTATMLYAAIAPDASLTSNFGETIDGPLAEIVVRNWGALIGLVGLMLIYGAFSEANRRMALTVAVVSKSVFIVLVLTLGQQFLQFQVGTALVVDAIIIVLFLAYLAVAPKPRAA